MFTQFLSFACVGALSYLVDAGVLSAVLAIAPGRFYLGRIVSYLAAASFAWCLNRSFTFRDRGPRWRQWRRYLVANLGGGLANYATYATLVAIVPFCRLHPTAAVAAGSLAGMMLNFTASRRFVFARQQKTA